MTIGHGVFLLLACIGALTVFSAAVLAVSFLSIKRFGPEVIEESSERDGDPKALPPEPIRRGKLALGLRPDGSRYSCARGHENDHSQLEKILTQGGEQGMRAIRSSLAAGVKDIEHSVSVPDSPELSNAPVREPQALFPK